MVVVVAAGCSAARAQGAMQIDGAEQPAHRQQNGDMPQPPGIFLQKCSLCHGGDARGTDRGLNLVGSADLGNMSDSAVTEVIRKGRGRMPAFPLSTSELGTLTHYLRLMNPAEQASGGSSAATVSSSQGEALFFGSAGCSGCHTVRGRGGVNGPDLSDIGSRLHSPELTTALTDPDARIAPGYATMSVTRKDGSTVQGFARAQRTHDLVLQTRDGKLVSLLDTEYTKLVPDTESAMPPFDGTQEQQKELVEYMTTLRGAGSGPLKGTSATMPAAAFDRIAHPAPGEWPTYNGTLDGNRYSTLSEIDAITVGKLRPAWMYSMQFNGLETTPVVSDGVMYVTGNNQVFALDARTGSEIWRYERPKSAASTISSDAAIGVNRGVALLGNRVFYLTDDAHLLALNRLTGTLMWDVYAPEETERYGGTSAPLVVGDLVVTGVSGADDGIRGFVAAYKATTGELVWRTWTVPKPGEPGSGDLEGICADARRRQHVDERKLRRGVRRVVLGVGNPHPDTDGDERIGSNLYTNSDLALDAKTGKILWHYQFTPHDLHDWDANEPIVLVDTIWEGQRSQAAAACESEWVLLRPGPHDRQAAACDADGRPYDMGKRHRPEDVDAAAVACQRDVCGRSCYLSCCARCHKLVFDCLQSRYAALLRDDSGGLREVPEGAGWRVRPVQRSRPSRAEDPAGPRYRNRQANLASHAPGQCAGKLLGCVVHSGRPGLLRGERWRLRRCGREDGRATVALQRESTHEIVPDDVPGCRETIRLHCRRFRDHYFCIA